MYKQGGTFYISEYYKKPGPDWPGELPSKTQLAATILCRSGHERVLIQNILKVRGMEVKFWT